MDESWTIAELAELAAEALVKPGTVGPFGISGQDGQPGSRPEGEPVRANGRVRDVPNERLIRWYGTVGLVDPPLSRRGRVARYGRRHLLQLIAVKRRQAEGRSLAQIQEELAGATDEALAAAAGIPGPARFWARQPSQPGPPTPADPDPAGPNPDADADADADADPAGAAGPNPVPVPVPVPVPAAALVHGIRLAPGVLLLLDGADQRLGPEDMTRIANAARPLLRELGAEYEH